MDSMLNQIIIRNIWSIHAIELQSSRMMPRMIMQLSLDVHAMHYTFLVCPNQPSILQRSSYQEGYAKDLTCLCHHGETTASTLGRTNVSHQHWRDITIETAYCRLCRLQYNGGIGVT